MVKSGADNTDTGWEKLKTRREVRKLVLFYKIVNGQVPDYLTELVTLIIII